MKKILGILLTFVLMGSENSNARTIKVNSIPELQSAINSAKKGDVIELADNTYANAGLINIKTRASLFNGTVSIHAEKGKGCELSIVFG